jgi:hypothetical protein
VVTEAANSGTRVPLTGACWGMKVTVKGQQTPTSGTRVYKYQPSSVVRPSSGNALPLAQMSQKGLDIRSRPIPQTLLRQETGKGLRPFHVEWRTIWAYPIRLYTSTVCFPKSSALVATATLRALNHESPFIFGRLHNKNLLVLDGSVLSQHFFVQDPL